MRFNNDDIDIENKLKEPATDALPTLKDIVGEEKFAEKIEEEKQAGEVKSGVKNKQKSKTNKVQNKIGKAFLDVLNGEFLTKENSTRQLPFVLFLALIAMVYIANGYYAEHTVRKINDATKELKELHSEYITTKSTLMQVSTQSSVANLSAKLVPGLQESKEAPKKIVITKK